jgi:hypothetical protein
MAGVTAPTSGGPNPAAGEVSHLQQVHAQQISNLQVTKERLRDAPLLENQRTPADYANYIAVRARTWETAREQGDAPVGPAVTPAGETGAS